MPQARHYFKSKLSSMKQLTARMAILLPLNVR
jgi:hypothetical protein